MVALHLQEGFWNSWHGSKEYPHCLTSYANESWHYKRRSRIGFQKHLFSFKLNMVETCLLKTGIITWGTASTSEAYSFQELKRQNRVRTQFFPSHQISSPTSNPLTSFGENFVPQSRAEIETRLSKDSDFSRVLLRTPKGSITLSNFWVTATVARVSRFCKPREGQRLALLIF